MEEKRHGQYPAEEITPSDAKVAGRTTPPVPPEEGAAPRQRETGYIKTIHKA